MKTQRVEFFFNSNILSHFQILNFAYYKLTTILMFILNMEEALLNQKVEFLTIEL
jgi:hypothetical protein